MEHVIVLRLYITLHPDGYLNDTGRAFERGVLLLGLVFLQIVDESTRHESAESPGQLALTPWFVEIFIKARKTIPYTNHPHGRAELFQ
jgi:hypothetical protein